MTKEFEDLGTPQKPIKAVNAPFLFCANCRKLLETESGWCQNCKQKIDWSDYE